MMPAAKHFDPVLGVDVHIIQPPGPVPPVPVPHPFVGFIVDPFDYAPIVGATVMVNGLPRAQAGTAGKCVPPHIPIGGVFVKPPANECEMFMGSATVEVDGDAFSYLALPALSCQCIGMPPIPRLKKKSQIKSLVLPTSVVLPIPAGPPVLVGGPPTVSLMALGMRVGMAGLGKAFKKLSKTKAFKKAKGKLDDFKSKFKKKKGKAPSNKGSCEGGCPVDAITGAVVDRMVDFQSPGDIPFTWKRHYDSRWTDSTPLGPGWRHDYQRTLEKTEDGFLFIDGSGEEFELPSLDAETGQSVWAGLTLTRLNDSTLQIARRRQPTIEFEFSNSQPFAQLTRLRQGKHTVLLRYNQLGQLADMRFSDGRRYFFSSNARGQIVKVEVAEQGQTRAVVTYTYSDAGTLIQHTDALGHRTAFEYDLAHRLTCKRDARNYGISYQYDEEGRCTRTWGQDGLYDEHFEYRPHINQSIRRSANGAQWTFHYDDQGTATEVIDPYGNSRQFVLDDLGQVVADVDENGQTTQLLYDEAGGHYARLTPNGDIQPTREHDLHPADRPLLRLPKTPVEWHWGTLLTPDRIAAHSKANNGHTAGSFFDAMGRITEKANARGGRETWKYDACGNVIEHTDADGGRSRTEVSSWNLPRRKFDPNGAAVEYEYNLHEYVTKIVDPAGATSEYLYDLKDRIVEVRRHGKVKERYAWDGAGNLLEKRDGQDQVLLAIDIGPDGLPAKRTLASGEIHEFEHNELGHVTRAATQTSEILFERDGAGRALAELRDGQGVEHALAFNRLGESVHFGQFTTQLDFEFDGSARITDPTGQVHRLQVRYDGKVERTLAHGTQEVSTYDADGQIVSRETFRAGGRSDSTRYAYSLAGDLIERRRGANVRTFEYDAAHRLAAETAPDGQRADYARDAAGNLLRKPGLEGVTLTEGNRLVQANGETFQYNDRNHIAERISPQGKTKYAYDAKDMLVGVTSDGFQWTAEYDPLGRRIRKTVNGETTEFYWDENRLAAEVQPDGSCRIFVYADLESLVPIFFVDYDSVQADPQSGRVYHVFVDQRGCPEWVEDAQGKVVWEADIDPYGIAEVSPQSDIEFNLRMPGHYYDVEIGLHYNRFRYYSPHWGRYLQSDPIGQSGGYNLYAYCHNPLTHVDLVGWDHSNDLGGSKKTGDAESPTSAKLGDSDAAEAVAAKGGMDPGHLKNLQKHCADNNRMVVMRGGNQASVPHIRDPNGIPKSVDCKLNTAKSGKNKGKVTTGQSPDKWPPKSEGGKGYQENLDQLKKDGYTVEDGVLKDPDGNYVHGDYDMQGAYDKNPDGSYGPPKNQDGAPYEGGTNDPEFQKDMNEGLNDPANYDGPDKDMVQHGANDDYKPDGETPGRNPEPDENYVVVDENGNAQVVEGTDNLKQVYDDKGIPWPY